MIEGRILMTQARMDGIIIEMLSISHERAMS